MTSHAAGAVVGAMLTVVMALMFVAARDEIVGSRLNRALAGATLLGVSTVALTHVAAVLGGFSLWEPLHQSLLVFAALAGAVAVMVDRRMGASAAAYLAGYLATSVSGRGDVLLVIGVCNLVLAANVMLLWLEPRASSG